jgi:serine/threonine protein kinase
MRPLADDRPAAHSPDEGQAVHDLDRVFGRGRVRMVTGRHVEVFREEARSGERRRYTKRFLATDAGDFRAWTEREWRILARLVGHGIACVPEVARFDRGSATEPAVVQTYDAGITVDHWATLLPVQRDGRSVRHVFEDCAHWWALARHLLLALDAIHELRLVHLDLKADNVCIPASPANFEPGLPGQQLHPRFEQLALIDFAFSLVCGDPLATALPLARQPDYDYQSPRLLAALQASRSGDLRPTRELDWRCDFYSLAALLGRYLPDSDAPAEAGWTAVRLHHAVDLLRRLHAIHDAELPAERPHADLADDAAALLRDPALAASLARGWTPDGRSDPTELRSPTPITRIAQPLAVAATPAAGAPPHRPPRPSPRHWAAMGATAAVMVLAVPFVAEAWKALAGEDEPPAPVVAAAPAQADPSLPQAPDEEAARVTSAAPLPGDAAASVPAADGAPPAAPPKVSAPESASESAPASAPTSAPGTVPAPATTEPEPGSPAASAAPAAPTIFAATPAPPSAPSAITAAPAAPAAGGTPAVTAARRVAASARKAQNLALAQDQSRTARRAPNPPRRAAAPAPVPAPRLAAARLSAPAAGKPSPRTADKASDKALDKTPETTARKTTASERRPWLEPRAARPVPTVATRPPPTLPPPLPETAVLRPAPAPVAAPEPLPAVPPTPTPTPTPAPPPPAPPRDLQARADTLLASDLPRIAERAERLVLRVLFTAGSAAGRGDGAQADDEIRQAATTLRLAPAEALAVVSASEARALDDAALQAQRRGDLPRAIDLLTRAFAANPLDADIAGDLAALRLRSSSAHAGAARQLALHALTTPHTRHPHGRLDDWTTLAIASALTGRERDARNAWYVTLALAPSTERLCRIALNAYVRHGERVRPSIDALLQRAEASGRASGSAACDWPPRWAGNSR